MENFSDSQTASEKKYGIHPDKDFDVINAASAKELTGLIPRQPYSHEVEEHYGQIFEYQADDIAIPNAKDNEVNT